MKILIVEDHSLFREGLRLVLQRLPTSTQIVEAASCRQALDRLAEHPDIGIMLLDYLLPDCRGGEALEAIRKEAPRVPVIVISALEDPVIVSRVLSQGASGYIPKSMSCELILSAIQLVLAGGIYAPPTLLQADPMGSTPSTPNATKLTERQRQVLGLLSEGKTDKEISKVLGLAESTVRTHMTLIFKLLNVANRTEASHVANKMGLV